MALFCPAPHPGSTPKVGLLVLGRAGTVWESRLAFAGLSTRRYPVGLEPVGHRVEQTGRSTSKSAVSRRFVAATETALADLLAADLSELDLVALGIGIDGVKHPLGLAEGSTENTSVVTDLLTGLGERGLDTTRPIFVGIDGGKALRAAVVRVFDHPVIARCQLHKLRNVADKLPDHLAATVTKRMRAAYRAQSAILAQAQLEALAKELERTHPGAAASLREGLSETLTVLRLGEVWSAAAHDGCHTSTCCAACAASLNFARDAEGAPAQAESVALAQVS